MTLTDFLQVLRRQWITSVAVFVVVVAASVGALLAQTPEYQATTTIGLTPAAGTSGLNAITLLGESGAILPLYSEAVSTPNTKALARQSLPAGVSLGSASVSTFSSSPTIMKITVTSPSPRAAQLSAQAYVSALVSRATSGSIGFPLVTLTVLGSPTLPTSPSSPHTSLTIGVGVLLGLILALVGAWLRETISGRIEDADGLRAAAGVQVFGEIPANRRVEAIHSPGMLTTDDRLRYVNEAMRDLAVALQLTQFEADSVLVTSPEGQQGKTTISFGIAVSLARSGVTTLLVDGDLRRGRIEQMFSAEPIPPKKSPGLIDVLRGLPADEAIRETSQPNLWVLPSGTPVDDPSELLDTGFTHFLRQVEKRFAVVIDGSPLIPINDARVISKFAGATLVVAATGQVTRRSVRRAVERLRLIGVEPTAAVLNRSRVQYTANYTQYLSSSPTRATRP